MDRQNLDKIKDMNNKDKREVIDKEEDQKIDLDREGDPILITEEDNLMRDMDKKIDNIIGEDDMISFL